MAHPVQANRKELFTNVTHHSWAQVQVCLLSSKGTQVWNQYSYKQYRNRKSIPVFTSSFAEVSIWHKIIFFARARKPVSFSLLPLTIRSGSPCNAQTDKCLARRRAGAFPSVYGPPRTFAKTPLAKQKESILCHIRDPQILGNLAMLFKIT